MTISTKYGQLAPHGDGYIISARHEQLKAWANEPNKLWPCSELAKLSGAWIEVAGNGDLVDMSDELHNAIDLINDELTAWEYAVIGEIENGYCGSCGRRNSFGCGHSAPQRALAIVERQSA